MAAYCLALMSWRLKHIFSLANFTSTQNPEIRKLLLLSCVALRSPFLGVCCYPLRVHRLYVSVAGLQLYHLCMPCIVGDRHNSH